MEIIIAKNAGFCFGVSKAVNLLFDLLENTNEKLYTVGPIIHNDQVVEKLKSKGVQVVNDISEVENDGQVVIRTHGVTPEVYEKINGSGLKYSDATCPYVKKIHNLVNEKYKEGYQIVIIGDKEHQEVKGINGWCDDTASIVYSEDDVKSMNADNKNICVVAQTTITKEKWETINNFLNKKFENILKFDTICSATSNRQNEAECVAKNVDAMVVIGGKNSSNTQKLYEICKKYCSKTYQIETSGDLPPMDIKNIKKIGITAGASTPDWVIKEVISKMEELNKANEMSFKEAFESSLVTLNTGDIVKGKIIGFNNSEVFVDLGYKSDGIIKIEEFTDDVDFNPAQSIKVGDEVEVFIVRVNDKEGVVELSKKKVESMKGWDSLVAAFENKTPVRVKVIEIVNGGVIASVSGIKIFIPASQVSDKYVKELHGFLKQVMNIRIIDYNKQKRKFVGSARVILEEEKEKAGTEFWGSVEIGKKYTGTVKSLMDFGAFVDIGGVDGLVHVSELSWNKIKHPSQVLKVGDKIEVVIKEFDKDKKKVSLGYKKHEDNPWVKAANKYNVDDIVKGKVVRLVPFGAFVELDEGVDGLVHISQISNDRIGKPSDVLSVGQEIEAKITEFSAENKKISLSIKEVNPIPAPNKKEEVKEAADSSEVVNAEEEVPTEHKEDMGSTIGDIIGKIDVE
ncbi:bifunctional 4-hydroxy-3-methylbut-2-enyl diphosphate reductase/30S ribosomal protein S1 [Pseudobacteroides cellulosolvens]|uniref:4-hydroxy-3-methylbut-2-enyl diphosphate reductase n=1 Tax=Pseudobacteroides cellulosolvens ATCC 35603 = DSM 2933 TaxID=398512 RepID=A0A0L6JKB1_9FIRM|nr:bifunctional 4-hydroxy-3-methylbut-2-enyl diphosphate reductase/30S ribosomal protein S1 [Pseudobacteroides cellulosolvens]KNY26199.1 4-hydroxy-3-methylbut-2-enyl diphosphate reductase [Pseudobacteroides cellulosolvens ATCC 35603 = DSM 2933]